MYIPVSSSPVSLFCPLSMLHMSMAAFKYWGQCSVLHYILAPSGWIFSSSSGCFHSPSWSWALYSEHTLPVFQLECSSQTIMWYFRPGCGCAQPRLREAIILFALDMLLHIESKLLSLYLDRISFMVSWQMSISCLKKMRKRPQSSWSFFFTSTKGSYQTFQLLTAICRRNYTPWPSGIYYMDARLFQYLKINQYNSPYYQSIKKNIICPYQLKQKKHLTKFNINHSLKLLEK